MALSNTTADAAATTYVNTMATRLKLTPTQKAAALANYKELFESLYASLKADIAIVIAANAINSAVSGAAASGPTPLPLTINPA